MMIEYAFPHEEWINSTDPNLVNPVKQNGMTLRDYFAAKAMQAILSNSDSPIEKITCWAYTAADAMLKEREK
jgi:hypothetical protein